MSNFSTRRIELQEKLESKRNEENAEKIIRLANYDPYRSQNLEEEMEEISDQWEKAEDLFYKVGKHCEEIKSINRDFTGVYAALVQQWAVCKNKIFDIQEKLDSAYQKALKEDKEQKKK